MMALVVTDMKTKYKPCMSVLDSCMEQLPCATYTQWLLQVSADLKSVCAAIRFENGTATMLALQWLINRM